MIATLTFGPNGIGHGLYTEAIDLLKLGVLHIERATTIEFDNTDQTWQARDGSGRMLFTASSRQQCLEWERRHFSRLPEEGLSSEKRTETTTERT